MLFRVPTWQPRAWRFEDVVTDLTQRCPEGSVSVGLATLEQHDTLDQLTERADAALYAGRHRTREQPDLSK